MIKTLQDSIIKVFTENINSYYSDYLNIKEKVKNSSAIYRGEPVDFLYHALFFTEEEYNQLGRFLSEMTSILNKVIEEYKKNTEFRKAFAFSEFLEELILVETGYHYYFPIGRFDIFYNDNGSHVFCELNTDGSSAMNEVRVIGECIKNSRIIGDIFEDPDVLIGFELFYSWLDGLIENYKVFNNGIDDRPNIAIVDFTGDGTIHEFKEFQKRFIKKGYNTFLCDPREFIYKNNVLYYKEQPVKLIYRRATTNRILEEAGDITDFLNAYREGAVCVVGGFVSQIVHSKNLFAILHDRDKTSFLSEKEKEFIKKHIPYTRILDSNDGKMIEEISSNKDKWILKPFDEYAGKGVYAGKDYSQEEWKKILGSIRGNDYILQEYINGPVLDMVNPGEKKKIDSFNFLIGLFTYNNKLAGLYTRAGRKNIIGSIAESFTVPNFIVRG
ncbi:MAG: tubulin--tyrosine ligase family protein [Halanaerobiaceae bacterium]|nr:tubulin--tyrosine ligase family protein [Halanaerobiaceae bacterium]